MDNLYIGNNKVNSNQNAATGRFTQIGDEKFYEIDGYDSMLPFFISLASDSNHWMYISSSGGLTAGRINSDNALFPYYTDDKIHESAEVTGSKTIIQVSKNGKVYLWEPFSNRYQGIYSIRRKILKSVIGNKIIFQEQNLDLELTFCYSWMNSDRFGWVKKSWLTNNSNQSLGLYFIDGIQNILPYGVSEFTQSKFSTLVDAYKKSELIQDVNLGIFRMESIMADRAEPSEALRTTTVWNYGLPNSLFLLSSVQLENFRQGKAITNETEAKGVRGAFFVANQVLLSPNDTKEWYFAAEVNQNSAQVNNLLLFLKNNKKIDELLEQDIAKGTKTLQSIIEKADGVQDTADENTVARHFSNTLFNVMRGGIYSNDYFISKDDFIKHIKHFNTKIANTYVEFFENLPESILYSELGELIKAKNDSNLYRLFLEYLPLTFSRRHGDPSRPWNVFNINVKDKDGNRILYYQGNWRDIFQNWEALSISYPGFINSIIAKFLNASTADGYNPYRITKHGIDWEVIEPDNPWSNIGYWGDHQIIYLLRLMELSNSHFPGFLNSWLNKEIFAYANVPYRIKNYRDIVANPKNTVTFDNSLHKSIENSVEAYGADAKLILESNGNVKLVSLTEKLLATLLAKLSNFIPEAGIWMNTLRPEWNDANNALVGNGTSMVTLYNMHRFLAFMHKLYRTSESDKFIVSNEIQIFFNEVSRGFNQHKKLINTGFDNASRKSLTDQLGIAGENYRNAVYAGFSNSKNTIAKAELIDFLTTVQEFIDQSIRANKRSDGMYHSYNLVTFSSSSISIRYLNEMLEGQVAILGSGILSAKEIVNLLDALRNSALYRPDQQSYILYPNKKLPTFVEKNNIPENSVNTSKILKTLLNIGDTSIVVKSQAEKYHFNADIINGEHLAKSLENYKTKATINIDKDDIQKVLDIYETIFDHQSFTGRSGTFYKYEGLGSIYWHMVSKLLLAIGESIEQAVANNEDSKIINELKQHYNEVKKGIGAHKSPAEYGSFPFDPYSHTPIMAGVQQPGMTGQVKEDIISRFLELGITVCNGQIEVNPFLLSSKEFHKSNNQATPWLSVMYCSTPFVYHLNKKQGIDVEFADGKTINVNGYKLPSDISQSVFMRDKKIARVIIHTKG